MFKCVLLFLNNYMLDQLLLPLVLEGLALCLWLNNLSQENVFKKKKLWIYYVMKDLCLNLK